MSGEKNKMWAILLQLGSNMWGKPESKPKYEPMDTNYHETMYCDKKTWTDVIDFLPKCGINTVLIDMGEGVKLDSHPELAIPGSWDKEEFREELKRIRDMGITPLPKYNFSCAHNAWMQDYSYMVGTKIYDQVCEDIVTEAIELFDYPEFIHLGLEEEDIGSQSNFPVRVVRSPERKTQDALKLFDVCKKHGVRPWIWMDPKTLEAFGGEEEFRRNIPKDVLVSNWYYPSLKSVKYKEWVELYNRLDEWGYEQVPTCSTFEFPYNPGQTMHYCRDNIQGSNLRGFMTAPWMMMRPTWYYRILSEACLFGEGKKQFYPEETK